MQDTATPETGPVPASPESIAEEIAGGGEAPLGGADAIAEELVKEAEGTGEAEEAPQTEEDATEPAEEPEESEEGNPEGTEADMFAKLLAEHPDLMVKIKVNGETIDVPLSELPNGYSRTEDYKAKTAAVAEERRQVEAQKATLETDLKAHYANQLEEATNLFARFDPVLMEAGTINWDALKAQDPAAFVAAQDAVNERLTAIQQMRQHLEKVRGESQEAQRTQLEQERAQRFDATADEIVKEMPELADEAKFTEFANSNVEFLRGAGFTNEEIVDALDHRVLTLADKARKWDAHVAAQKTLPEKKVVPKSAVKSLTSDAGSRASKPRFPANADRERKGNWIAEQILSEE
jgi:hypothetical protein